MQSQGVLESRGCDVAARRRTWAKLLSAIFSRIYPGTLSWCDYVPAIAICRSAAPAMHVAHARMVFRIERLLRLRGRFVRERVGLPTALSVWACALRMWRAFSTSSSFDSVVASTTDDVLVDCLLSVASAQSPYYTSDTGLRADLRSGHDASLFDRVCVAVIEAMYENRFRPSLAWPSVIDAKREP